MAFADPADVGVRLGRALTDDETAQAQLVIELTQNLIADVVGESSDWADTLTPVPGVLRALCLDKAVGTITNPSGAASWSKTLGAAQKSETYPRETDVYLSEREERLARRAVGLAPSGSSRPKSIVGDFYPEA
jgi:hypothetical protein